MDRLRCYTDRPQQGGQTGHDDERLDVLAPRAAEHVRDLPDGRVRLHRVEHEREHVVAARAPRASMRSSAAACACASRRARIARRRSTCSASMRGSTFMTGTGARVLDERVHARR